MQDGGRNIHPSLIEYQKRLDEEEAKSIEWQRKRNDFLKNAKRPLIERWISSFFTSDDNQTPANDTPPTPSNSKVEDKLESKLLVPKPNLNMGVVDYSLSEKVPYSPAAPKLNPNNSIVDYLISKDLPYSFNDRNNMWLGNAGKETYKGTAEQNTKLLNIIKSKNPTKSTPTTDSGTLYGWMMNNGMQKEASFKGRAKLYKQIFGEEKYTGSAEQNTSLLNSLKKRQKK